MQEQFSIKPYNTFGINVKARYFEELTRVEQLADLQQLPMFNKNRLLLGGGSNVLFSKDFDGIVLLNNIKGIEIQKEDDTAVIIKAMGGEIWHDFVLKTIDMNLGGLENLSLIPGKVGASPMQNIGAYGVEIKDVFHSLEAWNIEKEQMETFYKEDCEFGYRESIFKRTLKNKYLIVSVSFKLNKQPKINTSYGDIEKTLQAMQISDPSIKDVSNAVIAIRSSKLPNPVEIGNAGSFFKNPIISKEFANQIKKEFDQMPTYQVSESEVKIPAGWLIEQAGWKGKRFDNYGVHAKQALVLVNYGGAKGNDIMNLAFDIQQDIKQKFGVEIEPEVNFV